MVTLTNDEARSIAYLLEHAGYEYVNSGLEDTDEAPAMFTYHKILTNLLRHPRSEGQGSLLRRR